MTPAEILAGLQSVAEEHLDFEGTLATETRLLEALKLDSIRLLTFVVETENLFQVCLEEGDEEDIETAGDLVRLVELRLKETPQDPIE